MYLAVQMLDYLQLFKSIHIFGAVAWFGGLFMLVRIFVYHIEAMSKPQPDKDILTREYADIAKRVYHIICTPAMLITWIFGMLMVTAYIQAQGMEWFKANTWLHIKLLAVFMLSGYQGSTKKMMKRLSQGEQVMTSFKTRLFNEIPTILLLIIVLLAVYRNTLNALWATISVIIFALSIYLLAKAYKKQRANS